MDTETARNVLFAIATIGFVVWLAAMQFVAVCVKSEKDATRKAVEEFGLDEPPSGRLLVGRAEVEGQPAALAARAAAALANPWKSQLGPLKILTKSDDRVVFEGVGQDAAGQAGWRIVGRGEMHFASAGPNRTAVVYAAELRGGQWMLLLAKLFVVLGLATLLAVGALLLVVVVPHPDPAVRTQAVQMVQAVHFLWPPFLFAGLYRSARRTARAAFEVLVNNLPYSAEVS